MKAVLAVISMMLAGCSDGHRVGLESCLPGLAEGQVRGLAVYVSAPEHGSSTVLLSETCKTKGLALDLVRADQERIEALAKRQNPAALRIEGKFSAIDYKKRRAMLAPGATISLAPGLTGDQAWQRFRDGKLAQ